MADVLSSYNETLLSSPVFLILAKKNRETGFTLTLNVRYLQIA